jgi:hypothetical protein
MSFTKFKNAFNWLDRGDGSDATRLPATESDSELGTRSDISNIDVKEDEKDSVLERVEKTTNEVPLSPKSVVESSIVYPSTVRVLGIFLYLSLASFVVSLDRTIITVAMYSSR